jgi:glycosyltransferase involved in cell wall biosynthesis
MSLSVIIPTFNRRERLLRCLESLARQEGVNTPVEVLVVLDGCTDDTGSALRSAKIPFTLRVFERPNGGPGAARNIGLNEASGTVCEFLDDDVIAEPQLLATHAALHRSRSKAVGLGPGHAGSAGEWGAAALVR